MNNLEKLSDDELEAEALLAVNHENKAVMHVIYILAEIERRRLYSKSAESLHSYCIKVLKYDGGRAQRRIDTMRAMRIIPEIEEKVVSGELSMTVVSQTQSFLRAEKKAGKEYSIQDKRELFSKLENKSSRECVKTLIEISPESIPQDKRRTLTSEKTELRVVLSHALLEKLDRLKDLLSHKNPNMTDAELIDTMSELSLDQLDPERKIQRVEKSQVKKSSVIPAPEDLNQSTPENTSRSRYIPAQVKRTVWQRDKGTCSFTGCNSRRFIEYDHIKPFALGGESTVENLRLRCRTHNTYEAIQIFGFEKMQTHMVGQPT
jgi:hypothetical protein